MKEGECEFDHSFNGTESKAGIRPGDEGPQPPIQKKGPEYYQEYKRLRKLIEAKEGKF